MHTFLSISWWASCYSDSQLQTRLRQHSPVKYSWGHYDAFNVLCISKRDLLGNIPFDKRTFIFFLRHQNCKQIVSLKMCTVFYCFKWTTCFVIFPLCISRALTYTAMKKMMRSDINICLVYLRWMTKSFGIILQ